MIDDWLMAYLLKYKLVTIIHSHTPAHAHRHKLVVKSRLMIENADMDDIHGDRYFPNTNYLTDKLYTTHLQINS